MTRIGLLIILLNFTLIVSGQMEMGTYFQNRLMQASWLNPAFDTPEKWNISLPSVYGVLHQRGFTVNSILKRQLTAFGDDRRNQLFGATEWTPLSVSYKHGKFRYSLDFKYSARSDLSLNRPLLNLLFQGNASLIGGSIQASPEWHYNIQTETAFGIAYIGKFSAGGRIKFLNGLQNLYTESSNFSFAVNDEIYQLRAEGSFLVNTSFPIDFQQLDEVTIRSFQLFRGNYGVALDVGVHYRVGALSLSASVLDLGAVTWSNNPHNYAADGTLVFEGLGLRDIVDGNFNLLDTLGADLDIGETNRAYRMPVTPRFYLGGKYAIQEDWILGGLVHYQSFVNRRTVSMAVNISKTFRGRHALSLQYTATGQNFLNLGIGGYTTLGPFQWYFFCDQVNALFNPLGSEDLNFRTGINWVFVREQR